MKWYHGTSKQNAEKILKEGILQPGQDTVYDVDIPRYDAVYIADWDVAQQYALERNGVIIEVATPAVGSLLPDEDDIYELLNDRGGEFNSAGKALSDRVKALWLKKWNDENETWRNEGHDEEQFPSYPDFETAWTAWGEIEYEGSSGLSDQMKELTDYIIEHDPQLAKAIITTYGKAAHIGPLKVVGLAKKQAAKKVELIKTPGFVIEVPQARRKKFFIRPKSPLEYWAFKNRPRAFINEQIIFTFGGKPVAEAMVVKIEPPGHGEGEHKEWHKVYWKPSRFKKFRVASEGKIAAYYHGTNEDFRVFKSEFGVYYFTDDPKYAQHWADHRVTQHGGNDVVHEVELDIKHPLDVRKLKQKKLTDAQYADLLKAPKETFSDKLGESGARIVPYVSAP